MAYDLIEILTAAQKLKASDVHFTVGRPPTFRVRGDLLKAGEEILTPNEVERLAFSLLNEKQKETYDNFGEVDLSWSIPQLNRYRVNVYKQRGSCAAAMRMINNSIPTFEEINLPDVFKSLAMKPRGIVLVTGPTGSGKSTTLAAMVGYINEQKSCHILTIEEPIEYMHKHKNCLVNQREVGGDTTSFSKALRAALREDPDVILVGEMRDLETISTAISAAETGHFVMSTLHTTTAAQTVDRIIDSFPPHQQQQVRSQLSNIMMGIICQQLIKSSDGKEIVPAFEILLMTDAVRNLIREGKTHQINTVLQTNIKNGMMPMDYSLAQLAKSKRISMEDAIARCVDIEVFNRYISSTY